MAYLFKAFLTAIPLVSRFKIMLYVLNCCVLAIRSSLVFSLVAMVLSFPIVLIFSVIYNDLLVSFIPTGFNVARAAAQFIF